MTIISGGACVLFWGVPFWFSPPVAAVASLYGCLFSLDSDVEYAFHLKFSVVSLTPFPVYLVWFASQWGYVVITTPNGVLDHEEAIKQNVGGQVLGYFHWQGEPLSSPEWGNALCPSGIITLLLGLNPFCFGFWEHVCFPSWSSRNAITCQKY